MKNHFRVKTARLLLVCSLAVVFCGVSKANAGTVDWGASVDNGLADAFGVKLLPGSLLLLGSFDVPDSTIQANSGNISFLMSHFTTFGTSTIGNNVGGASGFFFQHTVGNTTAIQGLSIYIWAFNSPTTTTATQQGIFSATALSNWIFPNQVGNPNSTAVDFTDLTNAAGTALNSNANIVVGGFAQGLGNTLDFDLALIPEPSTYALAILGLPVFLFVRRKRTATSRG